eukprot:TRINITY_DN9226_c0_g1_i1.p1 TRINITY_DN9226_c0_g1~~TRINITY_DN9226_c0_g1_i1.p1  ORF type:complete len:262 (-),score=45.12 TRINITY_DN9226_c0_g1_i1:130-915(-)
MNELVELFEQFKTLFHQSSPDLQRCAELMLKLRLGTTKFSFKPPAETKELDKELFLSREILEYGAELSIKQHDEKAFMRYVKQLKPYYFDYKNLPESERKYPILGLYLLCLLAANRIGEFHTELEVICDFDNCYIKFAIELEQDVMEGRYNRIWDARDNIPVKSYEFFIDKLIETLRQEMADCMEASYHALRLSDAQKLLMFHAHQTEQFKQFVNERNWKLGDTIVFQREVEKKDRKQRENQAVLLINQTLAFAHDLERII